MKTTLTMVIKARQALDCGGAAAMMSSSYHQGKTDHKTILEAVRSCIESDEDLCLIKKLGNLANTSSPGAVQLKSYQQLLIVLVGILRPVSKTLLELEVTATRVYLKSSRSFLLLTLLLRLPRPRLTS